MFINYVFQHFLIQKIQIEIENENTLNLIFFINFSIKETI
jgi:hypothetical protein